MNRMRDAQRPTAVEEAAELLRQVDLAGWGLVILRADSEADIRRVVEMYPYRYPTANETLSSPKFSDDNREESIGGGLLKRLALPLEYPSEDLLLKDPTLSQALKNWFTDALKTPRIRMRHRILYVPNLVELVGRESDEGARRTEEQFRYLRLIRALCEEKRHGGDCHSLVVAGCTDGEMCSDLADVAYVIDVGCPARDELHDIIMRACEENLGACHGLGTASANELSAVMQGMREDAVRAVIDLACAQHENPVANGAKELFAVALQAKKQRIDQVCGLHWVSNDDSPKLGGMREASQWLRERSRSFHYTYAAQRQEVQPPKGVLLAGLPGCGKTLFAKIASREIGREASKAVPVVRLDLNAMPGKWLGQAEGNFTMALQTIQSVAPCVVIVDEIEKFFGGVADGESHETSRHIFSMFLDWMQEERKKPVLVIATANRVDRLPPELKRKGRFDETFFVGIPTYRECLEIVKIHLNRKRKLIKEFPQNGSESEEEAILDKIAKPFLSEAARKRRFLNGADIETMVNATFGKLYSELDIKLVESIQESRDCGNVVQYAVEDIKVRLVGELDRTRSYFDSNLDDTVEYWLMMRKLRFRNSGESELLRFDDYDEESGEFKSLREGGVGARSAKSEGDHEKYDAYLKKADQKLDDAGVVDYDRAFANLLARRIHRYVCNEQRRRS